ELCVESRPRKIRGTDGWTPPSCRGLKFNVDGFALGKPRPAGIRGVLRDSSGKVLCMFSKFIGVYDSNSVEIIAIHQACVLCASLGLIMGA
ncbi:hypothetical protein Dsin_032594, partial [Dipteronia sinensis]